jgi:hypothetical protein
MTSNIAEAEIVGSSTTSESADEGSSTTPPGSHSTAASPSDSFSSIDHALGLDPQKRQVSLRSPKLKTEEVLTILDLHKRQYKNDAIAKLIGCCEDTVKKCIKRYTVNTTTLAKRTLEANAHKMAKNVILNGRAADHVQVLKGMKTPEGDRIIEADKVDAGEGKTQIWIGLKVDID